jgi:hypothetical protein
MLQDSVFEHKWLFKLALGLFGTGPFFALLALCFTAYDKESAENYQRVAIKESLLDVESGVVEEEVAAVAAALPAVPRYVSPPLVVRSDPICVDKADLQTKKKPSGNRSSGRPSARRRLPRLTKGVTVLPKQCLGNHTDVPQAAAAAALGATDVQDGPIVLVNLGAISKKLLDWRENLPSVRPYYAVRSHADKKVVQLLRDGGCGFVCASTSEIKLTVSAGVDAQDIVFCEPHKLKSHVSYAKEQGVRHLTFDSAVELRKVASEYPTAQMLLRIALEDGEAGQNEEWSALMTIAAELRLEVVGVSFCGSLNAQECMEPAFASARRVFDVAHSWAPH